MALLIAAAYSDILSTDPWRRAWRAIKALFGWSGDGEPAPQEVVDKRLYACAKCPVFWKPLSTCGSPFHRQAKGMGCFCFLPAKARLLNEECWLDEHGLSDETGLGWNANT